LSDSNIVFDLLIMLRRAKEGFCEWRCSGAALAFHDYGYIALAIDGTYHMRARNNIIVIARPSLFLKTNVIVPVWRVKPMLEEMGDPAPQTILTRPTLITSVVNLSFGLSCRS